MNGHDYSGVSEGILGFQAIGDSALLNFTAEPYYFDKHYSIFNIF